VLKTRNGRPFVEPPIEAEDVAAIAAVLHAQLLPTRGRDGERITGRWKAQARAEGISES
jgi:hypothetical protein